MISNKKICILDYGAGNIQSVYNILLAITPDVTVSNKLNDIKLATHIILPGVGAFGVAMDKIRNKIPLAILEDEIFQNKKPFLGICVGMQVLATKGYEFGEHEGLGWIPGSVKKVNADSLPLPHVGWNNINILRESPLLKGLDDKQDFYFVHSYKLVADNESDIVAKTQYGENFNSIVSRDNIFGVQFHPEKSQKAGRLLLENFLKLQVESR
ncbi:MAG: imidazole glycerol phosphate synthase subunit HisH [Candidatus Niyogibacteria bacterium]|nr:imidazole glycerol phosphate synthase subunit HisH [Candidatus Niyogibacteria bacterium]